MACSLFLFSLSVDIEATLSDDGSSGAAEHSGNAVWKKE